MRPPMLPINLLTNELYQCHRNESKDTDDIDFQLSLFHPHEIGGIWNINPFMTNGFAHYNHLGESTFIFGTSRVFRYLFHIFNEILKAYRR